VRLVQRRQRFQFRQRVEHAGIDAHRRHEVRAAMHDAMAHGRDAPSSRLLRVPIEQRRKRPLVRSLCAFERRVVQGLPVGISHTKPRLKARAQPIGLPRPARRRQRGVAIAGRVEQRDLDGRRTRVERQQRTGHGVA